MIVFPNAKINLGLEVVRLREDGYRDIDSVLCPVDLCDVLEFVENPLSHDELHCSGLDIPGSASENLCLKALEVIRKKAKVPFQRIFIHKSIPMGSGLGGGSADAAFLLTGLNSRYELGLDTGEMEEMAGKVGSDCPFFIRNTPSRVSGRGERVEPVHSPLEGMQVLIAAPNVHLSTEAAYAQTPPRPAAFPVDEILANPISTWKSKLINRFEEFAFETHPQIKKIKDAMYDAGAVYASMTGTGSAVYGIFDHNPPRIEFGSGVARFSTSPL